MSGPMCPISPAELVLPIGRSDLRFSRRWRSGSPKATLKRFASVLVWWSDLISNQVILGRPRDSQIRLRLRVPDEWKANQLYMLMDFLLWIREAEQGPGPTKESGSHRVAAVLAGGQLPSYSSVDTATRARGSLHNPFLILWSILLNTCSRSLSCHTQVWDDQCPTSRRYSSLT